MGCTTCGQSNSNISGGGSGCCNLRAMDVDTPLANIQNGDKNFCFTEITDKICESLANDEGIHPSATNQNSDCDDLSSLNDLATGSLHNALMTLNMCDVDAYKCWLDSLLSWQWNVDKGIICAICGLWNVIRCIDAKNRVSVQTIDLWSGSNDIFALPNMPISRDLSDFDYLDLHLQMGTERQVARVSLVASGWGTATIMDKTARNTSYGMGDGAIFAKELGVQFPDDKHVKIDHFIWSGSGMAYPGTANAVTDGKFIALYSTEDTKKYCNTQDVEADRPHRILKIQGIISRTTASCLSK